MSTLTAPSDADSHDMGVIWAMQGPQYWILDVSEAGELADEIEAIYGSTQIPTNYPTNIPFPEIQQRIESEYGYSVVEKTGIDA